MTQPPEVMSSNNPYRASIIVPRTSMEPQRMSLIPERKPYMEIPSTDISDQDLHSISEDLPDRTCSYRPYRASYSDVPSLDTSEQSWDSPSPKTPDVLSEDGGSLRKFGGVPGGDGPVTPKKDMWSVPELPQYSSKRVLRKIKRLVKKRSKDIKILTVFDSNDGIVCSHEAPGAAKEQHRYIPSPDEGRYLHLALELGFKQEGCQFDFGTVIWLSGEQGEVDEKRTLLGSTANDPHAGNHQFYGVLSPTGRYLFAAILKETPSGAVSPKVMRKIRGLADRMEVYEAWVGSGSFMAKVAAKF